MRVKYLQKCGDEVLKLLTVTVPCYNSASYMEHCINTLLSGGEDIEILIVDDGSTKDNTAEIADRYAADYPDIVRCIHQENGGHGEAVNTGLANATGMYFKVVDSDDWVNEEAFAQVLDKLREFSRLSTPVDLLLSNYTYEHASDGTSRTLHYTGRMPEHRIFGWDELGHFRHDQHILMHSVIFRTAVLRESGVKLPSHCFYVDNIFVYTPLPYVRTLYYLNVDLYRYFIGREDQSVNEEVMTRQVDQQLRITYILLHSSNPMQMDIPKKLRNYMLHYLSIMVLTCCVFLVLSHKEEQRRQLWNDIRETDPALWRQLRYRHLCGFADMPLIREPLILGNGYRIAKKLYKFN